MYCNYYMYMCITGVYVLCLSPIVLYSLLQNSVSKPRVSKIVRPFVKGCEKGGKVENGAEVLVKTFNENSR